MIPMLERAGPNACRPDELPEQYGLRDGKYLSPIQAQEILNMLRLQKLTSLETEKKLLEEFKEVIERIAELLEILNDPERLLEVIREELVQVREEFGDARRTEIQSSRRDLTVADLITEETLVVTISAAVMQKTQPLGNTRRKRRGGRGKPLPP